MYIKGTYVAPFTQNAKCCNILLGGKKFRQNKALHNRTASAIQASVPRFPGVPGLLASDIFWLSVTSLVLCLCHVVGILGLVSTKLLSWNCRQKHFCRLSTSTANIATKCEQKLWLWKALPCFYFVHFYLKINVLIAVKVFGSFHLKSGSKYMLCNGIFLILNAIFDPWSAMIATYQSLSRVAITPAVGSVTNFFMICKYWPGSRVAKKVWLRSMMPKFGKSIIYAW